MKASARRSLVSRRHDSWRPGLREPACGMVSQTGEMSASVARPRRVAQAAGPHPPAPLRLHRAAGPVLLDARLAVSPRTVPVLRSLLLVLPLPDRRMSERHPNIALIRFCCVNRR